MVSKEAKASWCKYESYVISQSFSKVPRVIEASNTNSSLSFVNQFCKYFYNKPIYRKPILFLPVTFSI